MRRSFWSLFAVFVLSTASLISLQGQTPSQAQPTSPEWTPQSLQQMGLTGALFFCCGILWRTLQAERAERAKQTETDRESAVEAAKNTTAALITTANANAELRHVIEESVAAKRELSEEIKLLRQAIGRLPCTAEAE
jgi:hypothetical protein